MKNIILENDEATNNLGALISKKLAEMDKSSVEIHLEGDLGTGKTFLTRSIISNSGWNGMVKSPTYTLCEEYDLGDLIFLHIDLYRTEIDEDVEMLELNRSFDGKKIIFIEWPEKVEDKRLFNLKINMMHFANSRKIRIIGDTILIEKLIKEDK